MYEVISEIFLMQHLKCCLIMAGLRGEESFGMWIQTDVRLVPNQTKNDKYYLISFDLTNFLCVISDDKCVRRVQYAIHTVQFWPLF